MPSPPRSKTEWKDEYTLLCERCGYIIEDLDQALPCPECGKPITESFSIHRVGTPLQNSYTASNIILTWWASIFRIFLTLDIMRFNLNDHERIISTNIVVAVGSPALTILLIVGSYSVTDAITVIMIYAVISIPTIALLLLLTASGSFALRLISKIRDYRITYNISMNIVSHASTGWVVAGLGSSFGIVLANIRPLFVTRIWGNNNSTRNNQLIEDLESTGLWLIPISTISGFLFFGIFTYLGLQRCKYANRSRNSHSEAPNA